MQSGSSFYHTYPIDYSSQCSICHTIRHVCISMHLSITQEWVNFHKGGIVVGNQTWGVQLVEIEDYSDKAYANYGATVLMDPTEGFAVDFMFGPYSSGTVVFSIYCFCSSQRIVIKLSTQNFQTVKGIEQALH